MKLKEAAAIYPKNETITWDCAEAAVFLPCVQCLRRVKNGCCWDCVHAFVFLGERKVNELKAA